MDVTSQTDTQSLRDLLRPLVGAMKDMEADSRIPDLCKRIGLPVPGPASEKRLRMFAALDALPDQGLPAFAQGLIDKGLLKGRDRNAAQDILWAGLPEVDVSKRHRRQLARALTTLERVFRSWTHTEALLRNVLVIDSTLAEIFMAKDANIEWVAQHFFRFPDDADVEKLFERFNVFDLSNHRFQALLEGMVSADVQVDIEAQESFAQTCNEVLRTCGAELRQVAVEHGYPVYRLVTLRASNSRPKTLIFASPAKPDLRLRDVLSNDVEILSDPAEVLVYDRPIIDGLRWRELQAWWAEREGIDDDTQAKDTLYLRLQGSLPDDSPPQLLFFRTFFKTFGDQVYGLPALLPEVWLHWDPVVAKRRGAQAFAAHRMDFLMLLPGSRRLVFEIDGKHHYADGDRADPREYAKLAAGTRELQMAGYEVYRFGGSELAGDAGQQLAASFFKSLLDVHHVTPT